MENKINKLIYWLPRVLAIMFILFLAMFSLDVFETGKSFGQIAIGLLIHNIPVLFLSALLIISWKHEIVGAIAFILAGLLYIGLVITSKIENGFAGYMLSYSFIIAGPAFLIGALFLISHYKKL